MDATTIQNNVGAMLDAFNRGEENVPVDAALALLAIFLINQQRTADALERIAAAVEKWTAI